MKEPVWVSRFDVDLIHDLEVARYGGMTGIRDENLIESALNRPKNAYYYDGETDIYTLAAHYTFGIACNHGYADGNKRTAFVTTTLFLDENDIHLISDSESGIKFMQDVSQSKVSISEIADWLREHSKSVL